jgi:hypothetical protein
MAQQTQEEYQNEIKVQNSLPFKTDNKIDKFGPYIEAVEPGQQPTGRAKTDFDEFYASERGTTVGKASTMDNYNG